MLRRQHSPVLAVHSALTPADSSPARPDRGSALTGPAPSSAGALLMTSGQWQARGGSLISIGQLVRTPGSFLQSDARVVPSALAPRRAAIA